MANLIDQITVGDIRLVVLDADPSTSTGYAANIGSIAAVPSLSTLYFKIGSLVTDWTPLTTQSVITEQVQDIVGAFLQSSADISFTYNDAGNSETVILTTTGVSAGSQGSATSVATYTVDTKGRLTAAGSTPIAIPSTQITDFTEAAQDSVAAALTNSSSVSFTYNDGANTISSTVLPAGVDHNSLANLTTGDAHTQYAKIAGRSGGQSLSGGTAASETLTLSSTANATKGKINFGAVGAVDEANTRLGLGTTSPDTALVINTNSTFYKVDQATVATTNATISTLYTYTVPTGKVVYLKAFIVGVDASNNVVAYERSAAVKNVGGTVSQVGLTQSDFTEENTALAAALSSIDVTGATVRVRVTGIAATNITWNTTVQLTST